MTKITESLPNTDKGATALGLGAFVIGSLYQYGDASIEALGYSLDERLTDVAFTLAGFEATWALILALAGVAILLVGRDIDISDMAKANMYAFAITIGMTLLPVISGELLAWLQDGETATRMVGYFVVHLLAFIGTVEASDVAHYGR